jgi:hypothetical protein
MNNLTRFDNDGIEIFIDTEGNSFASISGVARMAGKHLRTIQNFIDRTAIPVITAEVETSYGKKLHVMLSSGSICKVLAQYNKDRLIQFAEVGVETALHQIAGYQQQPIEQDLTQFETPVELCLTSKEINKLLKIGYAKRDGKFVDPKLLLSFNPKQLAIPLQSLMNLASKINEGVDRRADIRQAIQQSKRLGFVKSKKQEFKGANLSALG